MRFADRVRYNLITKFVCANCGTQLALSSTAPIPPPEYDPEKHEGDVTGAEKVESRIAIHPCPKCYGEATEPIEALRKALQGIKLPE